MAEYNMHTCDLQLARLHLLYSVISPLMISLYYYDKQIDKAYNQVTNRCA